MSVCVRKKGSSGQKKTKRETRVATDSPFSPIPPPFGGFCSFCSTQRPDIPFNRAALTSIKPVYSRSMGCTRKDRDTSKLSIMVMGRKETTVVCVIEKEKWRVFLVSGVCGLHSVRVLRHSFIIPLPLCGIYVQEDKRHTEEFMFSQR
eukprot:gb/GECG01014633.1/.p1 GENE.gb/GECG01014633.1/~~gb/GECG01014633.1/.p1  ORF type:complete len:148 (+),score=6.16 gb/GECG01014633.1/:1-444(+)